MPSIAGGYSGLSPDTKARVAFMRFGLGPKRGSRDRIGSGADSAHDACLRELDNRAAALIADTDVVVRYSPPGSPFQGQPYAATAANIGKVVFSPKAPSFTDSIYMAEDAARYVKFLQPEVGFVERLVMFWNNHFSVSHKARPWLGLLERAAIRANVLGNFGDMLEAVETHPAMIAYLDNQSSIGPNSPASVRWPRGKYTYNENLAREILELHTLGVYGGYTQDDVISLAKVITGWKIADGNSNTPGEFYYHPDVHEPGPQTILGRTYDQADGLLQGKAVLRDLAIHPSTARHIAYKLIRHFITDEPLEADIATLSDAYLSNSGSLYAISKALLELPSAWTEPFVRIRKPHVWMVSATRALGLDAARVTNNTWRYQVFGNYMGHYPWSRITPDGFPDDNDYWMTPDALRVRNDVAFHEFGNVGTRTWPGPRPQVLAQDLFGTCLSNALRDQLTAFRDDRLAFGLLFMSPEFLWS